MAAYVFGGGAPMTVDVESYYITFYDCYALAVNDLANLAGQQIRLLERVRNPTKEELIGMLNSWSETLFGIFQQGADARITNLESLQAIMSIINEIFSLAATAKEDKHGVVYYLTKMQKPLAAYTQIVAKICKQKDVPTPNYGHIIEMPKDGNCLFHAVAHQLKLLGLPVEYDHLSVRKLTVATMREYREDFKGVVDENFELYLAAMKKDGVFGGYNEMTALMRALKLNIVLVFKDSKRESELGNAAHRKIHLLYDPSPPGHFDSIANIEQFRGQAPGMVSQPKSILKKYGSKTAGAGEEDNATAKKQVSFTPW